MSKTESSAIVRPYVDVKAKPRRVRSAWSRFKLRRSSERGEPRSTKSSVLMIVAVFVAVSGAAMAHVSLRLGVVRMGYAIGEQTRERRALEEQRRRLTTELSMLKNPGRIEKLAREKLHMELPDPSRIRTVRPGATAVAVSDAPRAKTVAPR